MLAYGPPTVIAVPIITKIDPKIFRLVNFSVPCTTDSKSVNKGTVANNIAARLAEVSTNPQDMNTNEAPIPRNPNVTQRRTF